MVWRTDSRWSVTWLSSPSSSSMKKKSAAQRGATGIRLTAFGYAMKARPGPATHTHAHADKQSVSDNWWVYLKHICVGLILFTHRHQCLIFQFSSSTCVGVWRSNPLNLSFFKPRAGKLGRVLRRQRPGRLFVFSDNCFFCSSVASSRFYFSLMLRVQVDRLKVHYAHLQQDCIYCSMSSVYTSEPSSRKYRWVTCEVKGPV